jgi:tetrahydromethanopterin S-methyltransferase subunit B
MDLAENAQATQLLNELDQRQDQVLAELDELNSRIEKVLELYLENRRASLAPASTITDEDSVVRSKAA